MKKFWLVLIVVLLIVAASQPVLAASVTPVPIYAADSPTAIKGQYIVVFKPGSAANAVAQSVKDVNVFGGNILYQYDSALQGFAAELPDQALNGIIHNPNIAYVEADQVISIEATQSPATWGLDRIDQHALPLNNTYSYNNTGSGVTAYIIDTGILVTHTEFGNRASIGFDALGGNGTDCNGHGTHVAGTIGGSTYGVAKDVSLVAVRVLNCSGSGTISGVIAGINWVTSNHQSGPAVANMSLGGNASTSLDSAVKNSIADGITYAIAAGNSSRDACKFSPARVPAAITVGATNSSDARPSWSNYGKCLDIFAPGVSITSAWNTSNTATNTISGTSMATPHVAGVAVLYLQAHPSASPADVASALTGAATANVVSNAGRGSPNLLLYSLIP